MDMATFYMHLKDGIDPSNPTYSVPYVDQFAGVGKYRPNKEKNKSKFREYRFIIKSI